MNPLSSDEIKKKRKTDAENDQLLRCIFCKVTFDLTNGGSAAKHTYNGHLKSVHLPLADDDNFKSICEMEIQTPFPKLYSRNKINEAYRDRPLQECVNDYVCPYCYLQLNAEQSLRTHVRNLHQTKLNADGSLPFQIPRHKGCSKIRKLDPCKIKKRKLEVLSSTLPSPSDDNNYFNAAVDQENLDIDAIQSDVEKPILSVPSKDNSNINPVINSEDNSNINPVINPENLDDIDVTQSNITLGVNPEELNATKSESQEAIETLLHIQNVDSNIDNTNELTKPQSSHENAQHEETNSFLFSEFDELNAYPDGNCFWHCAKIIYDNENIPCKDIKEAKLKVLKTFTEIIKRK